MSTLSRIDLAQFRALLQHSPQRREIRSIHLHHTWRPNHASWRGLASMEAMRRYHLEQRGFSDIAQHLTIDPDGGIWTGRDLDQPPASSYGIDPVTGMRANGDALAGPIAIELVGDFDDDRDVLAGAQLETTVAVLALLLQRFQLSVDCVVAHHEIDPTKSCPGTSLWAQTRVDANREPGALRRSILNDRLLRQIEQGLAQTSPVERVAGGASPPAGIRSVLEATRAPSFVADEGEMPEDRSTLDALDRQFGTSIRGAAPDHQAIAAHAINTAQGLLSDAPPQWTLRGGGKFSTSEADIRGLLERQLIPFIYAEQARQGSATPTVRLMVHAHGGLVSESAALDYANAHVAWWKANHIYPFFMIWETGLLETLLKHKRGPEGARFGPTDWLLEQSLGPLGRLLWTRMKRNAQLCSSADWHAAGGDDPAYAGVPGGARAFVRLLLDALKPYALKGVHFEFHAVGHSAGSIFHAHFLPMLVEELDARKVPNVSIPTLSLLAPAMTVDLFKQQLLPMIGHRVGRLSMFTMDRERERDDDVAFVYRKSLLYFVRNACESDDPPILGLQDSVWADTSLDERVAGSVFDQRNATRSSHVYWSCGSKSVRTAATSARHHGDFDNNAHTMTSVLALALGGTPEQPVAHQAYTVGVASKIWKGRALPLAAAAGTDHASETVATDTARSVERHALCIGVDDYPDAPLNGCVNDSRSWAGALAGLGYRIRSLENNAATRAGVEQAIREVLDHARDGSSVVIQFAGHGTQFADQDGDESDGFDEAYVPVDYRDEGCLLDDDLYSLLAPHASRVDLVLFFDTCHSGSASRFAPLVGPSRDGASRRRFLPASPAMVAAQQAGDARRGLARSAAARAQRADPPWLHLAACKDDEYAYETGNAGDYTRVAVPLLQRASDGRWTALQWIQEVRLRMGSPPRQHPQVQSAQASRLQAPLFRDPPRAAVAPTPDPTAAPGADSRIALARELLQTAANLLRQE